MKNQESTRESQDEKIIKICSIINNNINQYTFKREYLETLINSKNDMDQEIQQF